MAYKDSCNHYDNYAKLFAPCCNKIYQCRLCHNKKETHILNPRTVRAIICARCNTKQSIQENCCYCEIKFGEYSCLTCRIFDAPKNQYHCENCGICRIGPKDSFYHCPTCNLCLNKMLENNHRCIENVTRDNCAVCLEELHTSREALAYLICGHFLHEECFTDLKTKGNDLCPVCQSSLTKNNFFTIL